MSNTATAVAALAVESFPAGTTVGGVLFTLSSVDASGVATVANTATVAAGAADAEVSVAFVIDVAGDYTVSAQRQDGSGAALGSVVTSAVFNVVAAPVLVSVSVPTGVTVTVA